MNRVGRPIMLALFVVVVTAVVAYAGAAPGAEITSGPRVEGVSAQPISAVRQRVPVPEPGGVEEAVHEADSLYRRMVAILRNADIPERFDAVEDTVRVLWREIVTLESRYPEFDPADISDALNADKEFAAATEAFDMELERIANVMPSRGERLNRMMKEEVMKAEPDFDTHELAGVEEPGDQDEREGPPNEEERKALNDYETMIRWAGELFSEIQTPEDISEKRDDLLSLAKREARIRMDLPGERGEHLIESVPELVRLLQELGAEQMRLMSDPDLAEPMKKIFQESAE